MGETTVIFNNSKEKAKVKENLHANNGTTVCACIYIIYVSNDLCNECRATSTELINFAQFPFFSVPFHSPPSCLLSRYTRN